MSSNCLLSSGESQRRWVLAMEKNFLSEYYITDMTFGVFKVPKTLIEAKPEAYIPQKLGLGPLHHLRPDLYAMYSHKIPVVTRFFPPGHLHTICLAVEALVRSEPLIRSCYDQYLDLDVATLSWILTIDALFLFYFLTSYPEMKHLAGDVLMLENQIPLFVLDKVRQVLQLTPDADGSGASFLGDFYAFFYDHSPLDISDGKELRNYDHLLHRMYTLIVYKMDFKMEVKMDFKMENKEMQTRMHMESVQMIGDVVQDLADKGLPVPGGQVGTQIVSFVSKVPWGDILALFKTDAQDSSVVTADEIDIPSVSEMTDAAGIKFVRFDGGIKDIRFDDGEEEKKFYLPRIKITDTTEIVLRNLVAYEAAKVKPGRTLVLAEYVDLMCGIIDSRRDVEILRKEGIVESEMEDGEIARIFNGISKSEKKAEAGKESHVEKAVESVNTRYNSIRIVKLRKMAEKYGYGCFKLLSVAVTIVVLLLLTLQAFCSVFGCSRWFSKINN